MPENAKDIQALIQKAEQGDAFSYYLLGRYYYEGKETPKDYKKAAHYFSLGDNNGCMISKRNIADMYYKGQGVEQDFIKAAYYYSEISQNGDFTVQPILAGMYMDGYGVPKNDIEAYAHACVAAAFDEEHTELRDKIEKNLTPSQREKGQEKARLIWERCLKDGIEW